MRLILDMWWLTALFYMNVAPTLLDSLRVYHFCDTSLVKCYFYHNFDHLLIYDIEPKLGPATNLHNGFDLLRAEMYCIQRRSHLQTNTKINIF